MNLQAENENLRTRLGEMAAEIERLNAEREQLLAQNIPEPIRGDCYEAGLWSMRNVEALIKDGNFVGAVPAQQEAAGSVPDAYVPIHTRSGEPLWANAVVNLEQDHPSSYEMRPVYFNPSPRITEQDSPGIDFEDLQRKKNDPLHMAVSNWYVRLTYCNAVADEDEHVGYCCPLKMMSELEEILAAPVQAMRVPKQEHVDLFEIFEAGWSFNVHINGHCFDGRDVCRITGADFWPELLRDLHRDCTLEFGISKNDAIVELKQAIKHRLDPAQSANPLVDAVFAASDKKAADTFGKCPRCSHECAQSAVPEQWRLTGYGQIKAGDVISMVMAGRRICTSAKEVLNPGTDKEEVVYNRKKNHYFITSMVLDGTSNHKDVFVIPDHSLSEAPNPDRKFVDLRQVVDDGSK